jgi:tetratricopeptide (TPR) repeat protein
MKRTIGSVAIIVVVIAGSVMTYAIWNTMSTSPEEYLESGIAHYREGEYSRAIVQLLNAVQRGGATRDARYYLSASYFRTGDLTSAARELNALLESHPGDIEASLELGNIFLAAGPGDADMFGEAMRIAGKVLEVEPNNVAALVLSGNASAGLEDYRTSVEQFERVVGLDPNNTSAFISMGTSLTLQTDYERAERAF